MKKPQKSLKDWTDQEWTTKSGKPSTQGAEATGERYLPKKAIEAMSSAEYAATTKRKEKILLKASNFLNNLKRQLLQLVSIEMKVDLWVCMA